MNEIVGRVLRGAPRRTLLIIRRRQIHYIRDEEEQRRSASRVASFRIPLVLGRTFGSFLISTSSSSSSPVAQNTANYWVRGYEVGEAPRGLRGPDINPSFVGPCRASLDPYVTKNILAYIGCRRNLRTFVSLSTDTWK